MSKQNNQEYQAPLSGGMEDSKAYRRFVASSSGNKADDSAVWNSEMIDAFAALHQQESAGVQERDEKQPLWMRVITMLSVLGIIAGLIAVFLGLGKPAIAVLVVSVAIRVLMAILNYRRKQNLWIARLRENQ